MNKNKIFAIRLKEARETLHISQTALAEKVALTSASISAYEKGIKSPTLDTAKAIAEALGVSLGWLIGADETNVTGTDFLKAWAFCKTLLPPGTCNWKLVSRNDDDGDAGLAAVLWVSDEAVVEFTELLLAMEKPLPAGIANEEKSKKMFENAAKPFIETYGRQLDESSQRIQALRAQYIADKHNKREEK